MKHLKGNNIITILMGITLFVALCLFPPTYAAGITDMSGTWQIVDSRGKSRTSFHLHQQGASVTGTIVYSYGQAPVQGFISGDRLNLTVTYDNEKVLKKRLSPSIARQVIGITSRYEITIVPGAEELKGTFYGYWVTWKGNTVTGKYNGGSAEALKHANPKPKILRRTVPPPGGSSMVQMSPMMKLDRDSYAPGEQISVFFNALPDFRQNAWIGIIPSHIEHGSEAKNDQYDMAYQYLKGRTSGTLLFTAPAKRGTYDFRMHDSDSNGTEMASVTFTVKEKQHTSLRLEKTLFKPREAVKVHFSAPSSYADNAWIGIVPSKIAHGSEAENDRHDLAYQYLKKRTGGTLTFRAPAQPGRYDFRMHDTDGNGKEVASVTFTVGSAPAQPQVAYGTPPAAGICDLIDHIRKGTPFVVTFDMTAEKFNDGTFTGDYRTDPMGTLKGGESYRVFYRNGMFTCKGYSQHARSVITHTDGGANPDDGMISLWGRGYVFDGNGQVYDRDYGLVGHLRMER